MPLISLSNIEKRYAGEVIIGGVSLTIEPGDRVGLVGVNGSGKTTLLKLMTGEIESDAGEIHRGKGVRISHLAQHQSRSDTMTALEDVLGALSHLQDMEEGLREIEHALETDHDNEELMARYGALQEEFEMEGGYGFESRARAALTGLGFTEDEWSRPMTELSGGQKRRVSLAKVLLDDADLLLLDEPENHLDLAATEWLEEFLSACAKSFVIVAHDRRMLNRITNKTVEVENHRTRGYKGNYNAYHELKVKEYEQLTKRARLQDTEIARMERFVERFRYKKRKAAQAQSRLKMLERIERIVIPGISTKRMRLPAQEVIRSGGLVLSISGLSMAYGENKLFTDLSFEVNRGDRVGIFGPNGCGKSTLLKIIAYRIRPASGTVDVGHKVVPGYYDQEQVTLHSDNTVLNEIWSMDREMTQTQVRSFLGRFLFSGDDIEKRAVDLSGGERSRLALAKLVLQEANLLLMDEPTNHLDIASRETIEDALEEFDGTSIIVSHDRELLDHLVNKVIVFSPEGARMHLGTYSECQEDRPLKQKTVKTTPAISAKPKTSAKPKANGLNPYQLKNALAETEEALERDEARRDELHSAFCAWDYSKDAEGAHALRRELEQLQSLIDDHYSRLEALLEEFDKLS
ncbi:ABC-F family ATP-binding cassette domain-containing protein [Candidatus Hydrogenedentota bacterium]